MITLNADLARLYGKVRFYIGIKAYGTDGKCVKGGVTLPMVWNFSKACNHFDTQRRYIFPTLIQNYGDLFEDVTGRLLQLEDLRLSFCPADEKLSAVMLDDISDTCGAHVNVETSHNNFQGHFKLSRPATEEEAMCVIRMLRDWYGGDPGAAKSRQGRRFVTDGLTCEANWDEEHADVDFAIKHYPRVESEEIHFEPDVQISTDEKELYRSVWNRQLKSTVSYQHPYGDKSDADYRLAMFVLDRTNSPGAAAAAIVCARVTLLQDKGCSYAPRYVNRTVASAVADKSMKSESHRKLLMLL